jgi:tetraacyldisaccharide 4'-kinase
VVGGDRAKAARIAEGSGAGAIIMDDGYQNFKLQKDLALVVVDGEGGFGNGKIVPAGPLREPLRQGLRRADAVIVMGHGDPCLSEYAGPVLHAKLSPCRRLDGRMVVGFAGIGRPQKFFAALRGAGAELAATRGFPDHHMYTESEIVRLKDCARQMQATLVTTEKDFVRMNPSQREGIEALPVRAVFEDEAALWRILAPLFSRTISAG